MKDTPKILFEDAEVLVLSKAPQSHFDELLPKDSPWKAIHRLDFETSGCIVFVQDENFEAYRKLFSIQDGASTKVRKVYLAGCTGNPRQYRFGSFIEGWILSRYRSSKKVQFKELDAPIERLSHRSKQEAEHRVEGPIAEIDPRVEFARQKLAFTGKIFEVELITGARHQIRAFFESIQCPLVGDPVYGTAAARLELHSWKFEFTSPVSQKKYTFCDG